MIILINKERNKLLEEIEYYKRIANISKEDAQTIQQIIWKDKYYDYIIGFLVGLASNWLFYLLSNRKITEKIETQ